MSESTPHSMYENEHAEYLFAKVLAPHVCRLPLEQDRLDACHHLARLVEQLERATSPDFSLAIQRRDEWITSLLEQLESAQEALREISGRYPAAWPAGEIARRALQEFNT